MSLHNHKLLLDEPVIALNRRIAREIGPEGALVLQQMHFRCVAGTSDGAGQWLVLEREGRRWVTWNAQGRKYDLPLGKSGSAGSDAAFRRVIDQLVREGLVLVQQIQKSCWNRSNFYSIDYDSFHKRFRDTEPSILSPRSEDFNDSTGGVSDPSNPPAPSGLDNNKTIKPKQRVDDDATSSIRPLLALFVSRKKGDDIALDRKKLAVVERLCEKHEIDATKLQEIVNSEQPVYAGQLLAAVQSAVNAQVEASRRQQLHAIDAATQASRNAQTTLARGREEHAQQILDAADAAQIEALWKYAQRAAPSFLRDRIENCIRTRQLGTPPFRRSVAEVTIDFFHRGAATDASQRDTGRVTVDAP